jgi:hypothetical protein
MSKKTFENKKIATGNVEIQTPQDSVYSSIENTFKYEQKTQTEYRLFLQNLPLIDLQRHAVEHNVVPTAVNRSILEGRLEKEFLKKKSNFAGVNDTAYNH